MVFGQLGNARAQRFGEKLGQAQALLQANDAVLHAQGIEANFQSEDQEGQRQKNQQEGVKVIAEAAVGDVGEEVDKAEDQSQQKYWEHEEVERRIEAGMIGESLRFLFGHDDSSSKRAPV
ncbi:hypothetical protein SBA1_90086 [Candidatus Sulfotelmatobacter kueseliae]|uniref:Uncharacterized protein n=1 Tax=Candidatus Sulfotelmatobacter kueseliae TaxID=2042962 RepID=A0A2U3LAN6_9BACT|nr:hypothetical protein SBA1_90086 [Candidatus Sulfotelmatobacter kueseliae]